MFKRKAVKCTPETHGIMCPCMVNRIKPHSPPWVVADFGSHSCIVTGGNRLEAYSEVANASNQANAEFIVKAVNLHSELVEFVEYVTHYSNDLQVVQRARKLLAKCESEEKP